MGDVLIINNIKVDLSPSTIIALSSQSNDIGEIKDRQGNFSNTINLPDTPLNRSVFGFANVPSSVSVEPYRKLPCKYFSDGVEIVGNGYCVCTSYNKGFPIVIYSGNTSLFDALEGKNLADLDTTDFDMVTTPWNFAGVVAMYGASTSPCYFLIDDGTVSDSDREIEANTMYPMMRFSDIFNMIMTEAGFTFTGDIFSNLDYTKKLFPYCGDDEPKQGSEEIEGAVVSGQYYGSQAVAQSPLVTLINLNAVTDPYNKYFGGAYILPYAAKVVIKVHLVFSYHSGVVNNGDDSINVILRVNGVDTISSHYAVRVSSGVPPTKLLLDYEFTLDAKAGDQITLNARCNIPAFPLAYMENILPDINTVEYSITETLPFGGRWRHNANFPSMSQKDFLKGFMQMYSLQCDTDSFSKVVKFYTMDEVEANKPIAPDWSGYLDTSNIEIGYHSQKYGQLNNLLYKEDESVEDGTGNGSFTIDDQTLKPTVDAFTLPWAASENVIRMQGVPMAQILRVDLVGDSVKPVQRVIKSLSELPNTSANQLNIVYTPLGQSAVTTLIYGSEFDYDLDRLILDYGSSLIAMLQRYGFISVLMLLPSWEYNKLRHDVPVYVKQLGGMMYLNKVADYRGGKLCKVELIRM